MLIVSRQNCQLVFDVFTSQLPQKLTHLCQLLFIRWMAEVVGGWRGIWECQHLSSNILLDQEHSQKAIHIYVFLLFPDTIVSLPAHEPSSRKQKPDHAFFLGACQVRFSLFSFLFVTVLSITIEIYGWNSNSRKLLYCLVLFPFLPNRGTRWSLWQALNDLLLAWTFLILQLRRPWRFVHG
jgi:hypothetical protein